MGDVVGAASTQAAAGRLSSEWANDGDHATGADGGGRDAEPEREPSAGESEDRGSRHESVKAQLIERPVSVPDD